MRSASDPCLLCKSNAAGATNSHIFSRFISTAFLQNSNGTRKGYSLDSTNVLRERDGVVTAVGKPVQDSPKEHYILCPECEAYFGVLETLSRDTFISWRDKVQTGEYKLTPIQLGVRSLDCLNSNSRIIRLFVYSLFWRASISAHDLLSEYRIEPVIEESLRQILLSYKSGRKEFEEKIRLNPNYPDYPFAVITADQFSMGDANYLMVIPEKESGYTMLVDRFAFRLFENTTASKSVTLGTYYNNANDDCKMLVLAEEIWKAVFNEGAQRLLLEAAKGHTK